MNLQDLNHANKILKLVLELDQEIADLEKAAEEMVTEDHTFNLKLEFTRPKPEKKPEKKDILDEDGSLIDPDQTCMCGDPDCPNNFRPGSVIQITMTERGPMYDLRHMPNSKKDHPKKMMTGRVEYIPDTLQSVEIMGILIRSKMTIRDMHLKTLEANRS